MPLFALAIWLEITAVYGRAWFTDDGLASVLAFVESNLDSTMTTSAHELSSADLLLS